MSRGSDMASTADVWSISCSNNIATRQISPASIALGVNSIALGVKRIPACACH
jgi:hypothetical protein